MPALRGLMANARSPVGSRMPASPNRTMLCQRRRGSLWPGLEKTMRELRSRRAKSLTCAMRATGVVVHTVLDTELRYSRIRVGLEALFETNLPERTGPCSLAGEEAIRAVESSRSYATIPANGAACATRDQTS
jgi:hypothetical protein